MNIKRVLSVMMGSMIDADNEYDDAIERQKILGQIETIVWELKAEQSAILREYGPADDEPMEEDDSEPDYCREPALIPDYDVDPLEGMIDEEAEMMVQDAERDNLADWAPPF